MGRGKTGTAAAKPASELKLPRGISIREFAHERRLQVAFSFHGRQCRELLPPGPITATAVQRAAGLRAEILRRIEVGTFVYREYFPNSSSAVADLLSSGAAKAMMEDLLDAQRKSYLAQQERGTLAKSTADGYIKAIRSERMAFWHGKAVSDVTPAMLREWVRSLDVTAKFSRNLLTPLRSLFEDALNDELIQSNPLDRIALAKLLRETALPSAYEVDPFTAEERAALIKAARPDERQLVRFWFRCGLRPGELLALRWSAIDWAAQRAKISLNLVAGVEKGPKTAAGLRDVDLDAEAIEALRAQHTNTGDGDHVFLNPRTGQPFGTDAQLRKTLWQPLCERAAVRYRNPYQVRHTYASAVLTAGGNPWYLAQQMGHVDVQMVFSTYGKFIRADFQRPRIAAQAG